MSRTASSAPLAVASLPRTPGVYRFRDDRGRAIYIGRATDLRGRVASYWGGLADRPHLRRMVGQVAGIEALPCDSVHEAAWLERNLLERARPRWNRVRGGLEVPTWIVLEERRGSARLRVEHLPADPPSESFGPYLGGTRSRLAVAALHRVVGLAYAGERLSGSERDMARVRGVLPDDRAARVDLVRRVLSGDGAAMAKVSALLDARRDEAVAGLAFEVAGAVEAERPALAWITAPQRVTGVGDDVRIAGWADGILVELSVTAGRLDRWRQRPCDAATARSLVARTPADWAGFAQRAAALARALEP